MKAHFAMFAAYNTWANRRLYDAAAELPDAERRRDLRAFFGSLHRTMNHLVVGDVIWMARFRGAPNPPWPLDHVPHDDFDDLRAAREALDADIERHIGELTEDQIAGSISFRTISNPGDVTQPRAHALAHFFNHQTHHRGQCHALISQLGATPPSFDLVAFQRERGA